MAYAVIKIMYLSYCINEFLNWCHLDSSSLLHGIFDLGPEERYSTHDSQIICGHKMGAVGSNKLTVAQFLVLGLLILV